MSQFHLTKTSFRKGRFYANIFIHFMPTPTEEQINDHALPPYIKEGSMIAKDWYSGEYEGMLPGAPSRLTKEINDNNQPKSYNVRHESHEAAFAGDLEELESIAKQDKQALFAKDELDWQPIHEAVRAAHRDVIVFLVEQGADLNAITNKGVGFTPLDMALEFYGDDFARWLQLLGATKKYQFEELDEDSGYDEDIGYDEDHGYEKDHGYDEAHGYDGEEL